MDRRIIDESGKNKAAYILFAAMSVLILVMCFLIYYLHDLRGNMQSITLTEKGIVNKELKTDFGTLLPGESSEYTLNFKCKEQGTYRFTFNYTAKEKSPISSYVAVELIDGEGKISENLGNLLSCRALTTTHTFIEQTTSLTLRYVMANDVGDEAQGASFDFDLRLTIQKIG